MPKRALACLLAIALSPSLANALPVVAGFGDSITCDTCNDGSYLGLLADFLEPDPIIDDNGVSADWSSGILSRLDLWLDSNTADVIVLLAGTVDTYFDQPQGGSWGPPAGYVEATTVGNIESMINMVLTETSIPVILMAPPPVLDPCADNGALTCGEIDSRLSDLADELALLAADKSVPFLDLYAAFMADPRFGLIEDGGQHPGIDSLYRDDGLHPRLTTGDTLIASLLAPMIETALVPEPSSAMLLGFGLLALAQGRRSRRSA